LEIKSVLPFLLQEYILRSLLCLCAGRQRFRKASFVIFFPHYSATKVWRQVYKLIRLHQTLTKLEASVDDDDNNNNHNNSLAFG
jgi:hypothetical protein